MLCCHLPRKSQKPSPSPEVDRPSACDWRFRPAVVEFIWAGNRTGRAPAFESFLDRGLEFSTFTDIFGVVYGALNVEILVIKVQASMLLTKWRRDNSGTIQSYIGVNSVIFKGLRDASGLSMIEGLLYHGSDGEEKNRTQ